jgi:hypothetical protein
MQVVKQVEPEKSLDPFWKENEKSRRQMGRRQRTWCVLWMKFVGEMIVALLRDGLLLVLAGAAANAVQCFHTVGFEVFNNASAALADNRTHSGIPPVLISMTHHGKNPVKYEVTFIVLCHIISVNGDFFHM